MMKKSFIIFLMITAYLLNIAHDIHPHEHLKEECCHFLLLIHNQLHHHEKNNNETMPHEHQNENEEEIPFSHQHLLQSHDITQIRNIYSTENILKYTLIYTIIINLQTLEKPPQEYFVQNNNNICNKKIFSTFNLRAPPFFV